MSSLSLHKFSFQMFNIFSVMAILTFGSLTFAQRLDPVTHPKFVNPLPIPAQIDATKGGTFEMEMNQTTQWLGLVDATNNPLNTTVWGYGQVGMGVTYPGPTFVAKKNVPVNVYWYNNLPGHFLPVDASLHMAHPAGFSIDQVRDWYTTGNVPTVTHLHGGHTESASDGLPEAWYTQGNVEKGAYYVKELYTYHNDQEAATLWYHDHALGITRLNVYAGLAGFYLLEDKTERNLVKRNDLPKGKHDIEIVIQDRMFTTDGQLFWPAYQGDPAYDDFITDEGVTLGPPDFPVNGGPTVLAEFFGDFILVNGVAWPTLSVEPRPYRFRLLNGSDSRFYILRFNNGKSFWQIATDDGLLPKPVSLDELIIAPGERVEIVVEFNDDYGQQFVLQNIGPDEPYGGGVPGSDFDPADESTTGLIMQFNVNRRLKVNKGLPIPDALTATTKLREDLPDLEVLATTTRQLALFEGTDGYSRLMPMLGTMAEGSQLWDEDITENPGLNDVEIWEVFNATGDAHPIHLHLVTFQILNREEITDMTVEEKYMEHGVTGGIITSYTLNGTQEDPAENERGWKDTFIVPPGYVGRVVAKFDRPGRYVWHCHILSHEDHEMMRPYHVGPIPAAPALAKAGASMDEFAIDVDTSVNTPIQFSLDQNYPNPFNPTTEIRFALPKDSYVQLKVFNSLGQEVATLIDGNAPAGYHTVELDASNMASGIYFYKIDAGNFSQIKKMMLVK